MADLIDRQAAISDFEWCKLQAIDKDRWQEAIDRINALPSAQPEIIRCKDCKHLFEDNKCPLRTWWTHTEYDFCSYGERR